MDQINLKTWQENFVKGMYDNPDRKTQIKAGWYDWFCRDTSLRGKTKKMGQIVKQVKPNGKVDVNNWYVWFKNNCPMSHPLYDDFRFADLKSHDVQFTIAINCGYDTHMFTVYGRKNNFETPLFETDSQKELVCWLNTPWED